jgi:hypothetical protein
MRKTENVKIHLKINLPTVNKGKETSVPMSAYTSKDQSSISCSSGIVSAYPCSGHFLSPRPAVQWVAGTLHLVNRPLDFATHLHVFGGLGMYDSAPLTFFCTMPAKLDICSTRRNIISLSLKRHQSRGS